MKKSEILNEIAAIERKRVEKILGEVGLNKADNKAEKVLIQMGEMSKFVVWTKESIHELLDNNPKQFLLFPNLTEGFSKLDSELLSSFAVQVKEGKILSEQQLSMTRRCLKKHWKQLLKVVEANGYQVKY